MSADVGDTVGVGRQPIETDKFSGGVLVFAAAANAESTLRTALSDTFLIGVTLDRGMVDGQNVQAARVAAREFSALTAENDMKWEAIHPEPGRYWFEAADAYVEFGEFHDMAVIGHTLVWHNQTPDWVFDGEGGGTATRDVLLARMRDHIHTVAGHYRGRIKGWDVVNEAVSDVGPEDLRNSPWRRIIGEDYLDHAFRFAHEADPGAELYYNDYGLVNPGKRARAMRLLRGLIERGVPIDGVGLQGHLALNGPSSDDVEQAIRDVATLGLKVMITELDIDVLPSRGGHGVDVESGREAADPSLDPYAEGLPEEVQHQLAQRYADLFEVFLRHRSVISRVTLWGLHDGQSWLNHFPIRGRTNHPLLFDRAVRPKPSFYEVLQAVHLRPDPAGEIRPTVKSRSLE